MGQHWLLSSEVRDLCSYDIAEFTEEQALEFFCKLRWGSISRQICPECGVVDQHYFRPRRKQWRCKHCDRYFSVTTGTVWADRKLPYKKLIYMLSMFTSSPNGISASDLSRKTKVSYKTAWVFCHKLREAMHRTTDETKFSGEVHIDGGHFGGKPRSGQFRHKAKPQAIADKIKLGKNQGSKRSRSSAANLARKKRNRRIVMVLREVEPGYGGKRTRCFLSKSEDESIARYIAENHIERGALVRTDESPAYLSYSTYYTHQTVEHSKEYSTLEGVNNNQAESYFSRLRRSEYGVFHRMMARYMIDYATEMAWREDHRRETEGQRLGDLLRRSLFVGLSRWWRGYWQGCRRNSELVVKA